MYRHSVELFIDFIAIFRRLLIILASKVNCSDDQPLFTQIFTPGEEAKKVKCFYKVDVLTKCFIAVIMVL